MWRKVAAFMRTDGFGPPLGNQGKPNPLIPRARPATPLVETPFTPNPGNLRMFCHLPRGLKAGAPLVVALHGCGQTAGAYGVGAGWSQLADRLGFALLAPEQKAANNPATCFNWFNPGDVTRGEGEAASIAAMIAQMLARHRLDSRRVFITGLSAGGAMTAAMLAVYPELFAGGAIIAGIPFGAASGVGDALSVMRSAPLRTPHQWGNAVRHATRHRGPWPAVSIWHGDADSTVNVNNAQASVAQWADLHGLALGDARQDELHGATRLRWGDRLEVITVPGLGHGTPIAASDVGTAAPHILETGISSSAEIAAFWGLDAKADAKVEVKAPARPAAKPKPAPAEAEPVAVAAVHHPRPTKIEEIILRALKAAGLKR